MPVRLTSAPVGERRRRSQAPPGRTSISHAMVVKPCGPHQRAASTGSTQASKTRRRGAAKTRVMTSSSLFAAMRFPLLLDLAQIVVEAIEAGVPELAVQPEPVDRALERPGFQAARPPLRGAAARDQAGALQHLQVLGDRR